MTLKNKFLTTLLALLVGLSAIFGLALSTPAVTKADEPTIDTSTWELGEEFKSGDVVGGKIIRLQGNPSMWFSVTDNECFYFADYGANTKVTFQRNYEDIEGVNASDYVTIYSFSENEDNTYNLDVYFHNDIIKDGEGNEYFDLATQGVSDVFENDFHHKYLIIPEGYVAGENGIELASSGEQPEDEPKEDKDFFAGITDWINNAGETVSNWLGENTGIAISSSSVLFVGAIVIIILASSKRKK